VRGRGRFVSRSDNGPYVAFPASPHPPSGLTFPCPIVRWPLYCFRNARPGSRNGRLKCLSARTCRIPYLITMLLRLFLLNEYVRLRRGLSRGHLDSCNNLSFMCQTLPICQILSGPVLDALSRSCFNPSRSF